MLDNGALTEVQQGHNAYERGIAMMLTADVPKRIHEKLNSEMRKTGLTKSYLVRQILMKHYSLSHKQTKQEAA